MIIFIITTRLHRETVPLDTQGLVEESFADRNIKDTGPVPFDPKRHSGISDGFGAHILAGTVIDLGVRTLEQTQLHH